MREQPSSCLADAAGDTSKRSIDSNDLHKRPCQYSELSPDEANTRLSAPHLPLCPLASVDGMSFAQIRDYMTALAVHVDTQRAIDSLMDEWNTDPTASKPIQTIRALMDSIRELPRGDERIRAMNTLVRGFGTAEALATLLDMIRHSARRQGTEERELTRYSRLEPKHSLYGWCGQTKLISSSPVPTKGTMNAEPGVQDILGTAPASMWGLNMHIWQPNPFAKGFPSGKRSELNVVVEPPHSHPFDFASMVSIGSMHQSIYLGCVPDDPAEKPAVGRYDGVVLNHVNGVWPPHPKMEPTRVVTGESRVLLNTGDSYYMPCNIVHDVEIDASTASTRPTITLFLRSEGVVIPHVYMARAMVDFQEAHPDLERTGKPLSEKDWDTKLKMTSNYLRGIVPRLVLDDLVKQSSEYAFFHT